MCQHLRLKQHERFFLTALDAGKWEVQLILTEGKD